MAESTPKVVTLDTLGTVVRKIKEDYPTRTEVTEEINNYAGPNVEYATDDDVLALFDESTSGEETV